MEGPREEEADGDASDAALMARAKVFARCLKDETMMLKLNEFVLGARLSEAWGWHMHAGFVDVFQSIATDGTIDRGDVNAVVSAVMCKIAGAIDKDWITFAKHSEEFVHNPTHKETVTSSVLETVHAVFADVSEVQSHRALACRLWGCAWGKDQGFFFLEF